MLLIFLMLLFNITVNFYENWKLYNSLSIIKIATFILKNKSNLEFLN
jgi:hypothetical protein